MNNNTNNMENQNQQVAGNNTATPVPENQVQNSEVQEPVVNTNTDADQSGDASDITFDYNQIYGVTETNNQVENTADDNLPVFDEKEIVIDENKLKRETDDIVPEFRIDELEGSSILKAEENKPIDELMDDKEADKADTRRKIAYILVIVLILVVFVWFIFPIMAGYNF